MAPDYETHPSGADDAARATSGADSLDALRALNTVLADLHSQLELRKTLASVARGALAGTCFGAVVMNLVRDDGCYEVVAVEGPQECRDALLGVVYQPEEWRVIIDSSVELRGLRFVDHDQPIATAVAGWTPSSAASDEPTAWHPDSILFAALTAPDGNILGALSVDLPEGGRWPTDEQLDILRVFADHAALAIERAHLISDLEQSRASVQHIAWHDQLTGLANRQQLNDRLDELGGGPHRELAALVIDLNGFKQINDQQGHHVGDQLLRVVAKRLSACARDGDLIVRYGGDEFVVLLPGDDVTATAHAVAERVRAALAEPVVLSGDHHVVPGTVGVAIGSTPVDLYDVIERADHDMYRQRSISTRL